MPTLQFKQPLLKFSSQKGSYHYLKIEATTVEKFKKKKATRLQCTLENSVIFDCGFNHLGDGNFYLIVSKRHLKKLKKQEGDILSFQIEEHPEPLGVKVPEVLEVLLSQDLDAKAIYDTFTDGRKRTLIYTINRVKDIDKQVQKILAFLEQYK